MLHFGVEFARDRLFIDNQYIPNTGLVFLAALTTSKIFISGQTLTPNIEAHKIDDIQFMSAGCSYLHLIFTYLMYIKVEALYGDDIHLTIAHKRE